MYYSEIKKLRQKYKISQLKLSKISGFSPATISNWELEKTLPSSEDIAVLFSALQKAIVLIKSNTFDLRKRRITISAYHKKDIPKPIQSAEDYLYWLKNRGDINKTDYVKTLSDLYQAAQKPTAPNAPKTLALFSGCGGLSLGFAAKGYNLIGHVEIESSANDIYADNFPNSKLLAEDICSITDNDLKKWQNEYGPIDVIIGGPPCQGFSLAGKRNPNDTRNQLYKYYVHIVSILRPKVFVMENVRLLTSMRAPDGTLFIDNILSAFQRECYTITKKEINTYEYGVPQSRERIIIIGVRNDINRGNFMFPIPTHSICSKNQISINGHKQALTFRDATCDLPYLESGESSSDPLHWSVSHPEHVIKWLKNVPEGCSAHENKDPALRPPSGFNTTYKRIVWDEPCSTISTNFSMISGCRNVHPTATRALTIREAARVQSFPDEFIFKGNWGNIRKAIGNAVPPLFAQKLAEEIFSQLLSEDD